MSCLEQIQEIHLRKQNWWISTAQRIEETKRTYEDLQVQIHRKITKTPQHRHCFVRQPMIK